MPPRTHGSRRLSLALHALLPFVIGTVACSSTTEDTGSSDGKTACGQYFDGLSRQDSSCLPLGMPASSLYKPVDKTTFEKQCVLDLAAPGTGWTPASLSECAAAMEKAHSCESKTAACATPAGSLADGAGCTKSAQCKGRLCRITAASTTGKPTFCGTCATVAAEGGDCKAAIDCDKALFCLAGKCAKPPAALGEGSICAQTDSSGVVAPSLPTLPCEAGLYCNTLVIPLPSSSTPSAPKCEKRPAKGERCTLTECQEGLRCSGGACVDPAEARDDGADCTGNGDCKSGYCDRGNLQCKAVTLVGVGAPCTQGVRCTEGLTCYGTTDEASTCVERIAEGAACTNGGPPCTTNTVCRDGKCQLNDAALCR